MRLLPDYSLTQWVLFFFWYCFLGWVWECFYVSFRKAIKTKQWEFVNRGFLNGPVIPIYGFAAITILLTTLKVKENILAIYVIGALTATLFELVTGSAMEKLFKVKYWDYSEFPLSYKGHICFFVSLVWGLFAILLVKVIHVFIDGFLLQIPHFVCEMLAFVLLLTFGYDFKMSLNEAMDLRDILEVLTENNNAINRIEHRISSLIAFSSLPSNRDFAKSRLDFNNEILYNIEKFRWQREQRIQKIEEYLAKLDEDLDRDIVDVINEWREKLREKNNKTYFKALKQLRRNPSMKSEKHKETIESLKELLERKK